ncbi:hypothetical protein ACUHMQ_16890 [Chitinimonas sp. PSY-7]|uniref:hypothetical protein n=1 Tax=Chitinimonas sp. PSY-7 TaxID=3459088 RepID=UPI00403FEF1C
MPLAIADTRHLHLLLADAASGTPRQLWHLEIAAQFPPGPPSTLGKVLGWLVAACGTNYSILLLHWLQLAGLAPYRQDYRSPYAHHAKQAAQLTLYLLTTLQGLNTLNASRELCLILLGLMGGVWAVWRESSVANQHATALRNAHTATAAELTPSESALGLAGLLVAAGRDYIDAQQEAHTLATAPNTVTSKQLAELGMQAPVTAFAHQQGLLCGLCYLAGVLAVGWSCWLTAAHWQLLVALFGMLLVHFVADGHQRHWWRATLRPIAISLACFAAGWGLSRLY